jgi:hypothetical protein
MDIEHAGEAEPPVAIRPAYTLYYYVVASEDEAATLRAAQVGAFDHFGSGQRPESPVVVLVAPSQDTLYGLVTIINRTTQAGGPAYKIIDLRETRSSSVP